MLNGKSQISIEYLILTGFIVLAIAISSALFLRTFFSSSAYDVLNTQKIHDLGDDLAKKAKQIYYLGLYSKQSGVYEVPKNVEKMFIVELTKGSDHFYYFAIHIMDKDLKKYYFISDVPLMSQDAFVDTTIMIPECSVPGTSCKFYSFKGNLILEGKRVFKLETRLDGNQAKVSITPG